MRPEVPAVCRVARASLEELMGPNRPGAELMALGCTSVVRDALARHWNDAAASRVDEIASLTALVVRGADLAPPAVSMPWQPVLAAQQQELDLGLSALEARADALRSALIEVHAWAEGERDAAARELVREIWIALEAIAERNLVPDTGWF